MIDQLKPMKLSHVDDPATVEALLRDEMWAVQQKMDGTFGRAVLRYGEPPLMTQNGVDPLKHTAATQHLSRIWDGLSRLQFQLTQPGDMIALEGEIMLASGEFRVFELVHAEWDGLLQVHHEHVWHRRNWVRETLATLMDYPVIQVRTARKEATKRELLDRCRTQGVEGVVFKKIDSPYQPGTRTKDVLKYKFVKTADVVVTAVDRPDPKHGSFSFAIYQDGELVPLGRCSAIGKPHVEVGDVIEVAFLYRDPNGRGLVQPRMTRVREDKPAEACQVDQFQVYTREVV